MCPNCNKKSFCGCKSCKPRKRMSPIRNQKFVNGDFIKCPYCRVVDHVDEWLNAEIGIDFSRFYGKNFEY